MRLTVWAAAGKPLARLVQLGDTEPMKPLMLHHSCDLGPIKAVTAQIEASEAGLEAQFRLDGAIDRIRLPEPGRSERTDGLWKSTCLEVFWQPLGQPGYTEFNLSPCGRWAAYEFDHWREGMRKAPLEAITIDLLQSETGLTLKTSIAAQLSAPAQVGLSAVIEHADGALQYWALAFPPGKPDFHSEACRQWVLDRE